MKKSNGFKQRYIPVQTFDLDFAKMAKLQGPHLFQRTKYYYQYLLPQRKAQLWLYNRRMLTGVAVQVLGLDQNSNLIQGINFASADYLGLAQSPKAVQAAIDAAKTFGVNSAGSPLAFGMTKYYAQLVQQLKQFWNTKALMIYSAGWLAGFGVIKGLIRPQDHVVIDSLGHNCLQQGAKASTKNVYRIPHLDQNAIQNDKDNAILVCTQGLFSMDSDSPDLNSIQKMCLKHKAFLLIDCAHDFGCMGLNGKGVWQLQNLEDRSNVILIGTGSKTLSTNIGFAACQDQRVIQYLKIFSTAYMFTNAINPVQAATSLANLRILGSQQGKIRRAKVMQNYAYLRKQLQATGNKIFGQPCPILPLFVGNQFVCRMTCRLMLDSGFHVNGIQFPVVSVGQARLRVNLMPQHTKEHLDSFVQAFNRCRNKAQQIVNKSFQQYKRLKQKANDEAKL